MQDDVGTVDLLQKKDKFPPFTSRFAYHFRRITLTKQKLLWRTKKWKDEKIDLHLSIYLIDCIFAYFVKMTNVLTPGMVRIDPTYNLH